MKIKARGFIPDIILELLAFATRKELAKLQLASYVFYILIERYHPRKPFLSIMSLYYGFNSKVLLLFFFVYITSVVGSA